MRFFKNFSQNQIRALLKKDFLIRIRKPWMTLVQFLWPCLLFLSLYTLRHRFQPKEIADCQFPTRQLPTKHNIIPFFHSYICTIENRCEDVKEYHEISKFEKAPLKPILNIVQILLREKSLFEGITQLPDNANWVSTITRVATHSRFSEIQSNIATVVSSVPEVEKMVNGSFDIKKMFSSDETFAKSGKIICGYPFPHNHEIPLVTNIIESDDLSETNKDELDAMPTPYCKQLYLDIVRSNRGKMTWSQIKPIIHGKILFGPVNNETLSIIKFSNNTFEEMNNLRLLAQSFHMIITKLHTNETFIENYKGVINLLKSPFVRAVLGDSFNSDHIESIMNRIREDETIADIFRTVYNIFECFSVDRFIPVNNELELEQKAIELNKQRLFYAGVYFNNTNNTHFSYKLRVDTENTPKTIETKNRFWFPGPEASMIEDLRYHRGFVQIQHSIDLGIIRHRKSIKLEVEKKSPAEEREEWLKKWRSEDVEKQRWGSYNRPQKKKLLDEDDDDFDEHFVEKPIESPTTITPTSASTGVLDLFGNLFSSQNNESDFEYDEDFDEPQNQTETINSRRKRQLNLMSLLGSNFDNPKENILVDDIQMFTKQIPYPEYTVDDFKKGLYLAQSVPMAFFLGLLIEIAACVRYRIWMKESKNTMLMRTMGLKASSEIISWIVVTFIELILIFLIACAILFGGGIIQSTGFIFIFVFLLVFGACTVSFCYMCSTIFSSASIGSVSTSILFLLTFLPYIIIICLDLHLASILRFLTNLSYSTAFCYAFDNIMRSELQGYGMSYSGAFFDGFESEFTYGICMIVLDAIIYGVIGYIVERIRNDEYKFHKVERKELNSKIGAVLENVSKTYDNIKVVVTNVSLEFPKDKITCLLGRNGAGKSTILKILTGEITPTSGKIYLSQASNIRNEQDRIGLCCQDNILIPHLTAREHLEMYARIKIKKNFESEIDKTMQSLKLGKYENYEAYKLSGGYQRRLCVANAFIGSPNIVILDEPCSSIDMKTRNHVWSLVEELKVGRSVILATHFLDEAEYFSDSVVIMHNGVIISKFDPKSIESLITNSFQLNIQLNSSGLLNNIKNIFEKYLNSFEEISSTDREITVSILYDSSVNNYTELFKDLEKLQYDKQINRMSIKSKSLETIFNDLSFEEGKEISLNGDTSVIEPYRNKNTEKNLNWLDIIRNLFWKRFLHLKRNYRLILCILVLPLIFEVVAMGFMKLRPGGEYDNELNLTRQLYPESSEFFSLENKNDFTNATLAHLKRNCGKLTECHTFSNSEKAFYWVLETGSAYIMDRYGGITVNKSIANVWYNNKGHHSMVAWLNDLNSEMFKVEMNSSDYRITTINQPLNLDMAELSTSSMLQQVSDAGISLILLIAFSLVAASASVFLVNERVSGEKLQQTLCGVKPSSYWTVAFLWDFVVFLCSLVICVIILKIFNIPVFVAKSNLNGVCLIIVLYGFASIPCVHVFEKLFSEASFANMSIFCLNVIIALTTLTIIILFDVLGNSQTAANCRNFLNRAFLIFPQHAFADGLIEICKNYITAEVFVRYDIDSYKSPVASELLLPHYIALIVMGIIFFIINYIIESDLDIMSALKRIRNCCDKNTVDPVELKIVSIQNSVNGKTRFSYTETPALQVNNLQKSYKSGVYAVQDVSFKLKNGECFGLLGKNGAGKSTIFKILTGQLRPDYGNFQFLNHEISYCPQSIALDPLLTVREIIEFYGNLRKIPNIKSLITRVSKLFNLENYQNCLVTNLSGGNRRKLNVAVSCIGDSSVILMDEPTSDMDPITRIFVYRAIHKLLEEGKSVLLTSHAITEIDKVCQQIGIISNGKLIDCGNPEELAEKFGGYYNVTLFFNKTDHGSIERDIKISFSHCQNLQIHPNSIKFIVKVKGKPNVENGSRNVNELTDTDIIENNDITFSNLFDNLKQISSVHKIRFSITRCGLDVLLDQVLTSNTVSAVNESNPNIMNNISIASNCQAVDGGYIHQGFVP